MVKEHICNDPEYCWDHLKDANDRLQARVKEAEKRGVDFWHLIEGREAGWRYALECRQARVRELRLHIARLEATVEGLDTDLTEMTTTMTEHFDSVDLNDLPVSLTKGIKALEALAERRKGAVGLCHDVPTMLNRLAESRAREGELVAALEKIPAYHTTTSDGKGGTIPCSEMPNEWRLEFCPACVRDAALLTAVVWRARDR